MTLRSVFCNNASVYLGLMHDMFFSSVLSWYHNYKQTKTQKHKNALHTQVPIDWHSEISTYQHHLLCAHSSYVYYTVQRSTMSLLFKNSWLVEATYLSIRFSNTTFFSWSTNTKRYDANKLKTHPHSLKETHPHSLKETHPNSLKERQDWKGLVSMQISDRVPPLFTNPFLFIGKSEALPPFLGKFWKLNPTLPSAPFIKRGSNYVNH